jgi:glutamate synthase (NADPH/NADH) large chain
MNCNQDMVDLEPLENMDDVSELQQLLREHHQLTGSTVAADLMANWELALASFVKVMPRDYKRVLSQRAVQGEAVKLTDPPASAVDQASA